MKLIWGPIVVGINDKSQIFGLWFEGQKYFPRLAQDALFITDEASEMNTVIRELAKQLREYEAGKRKVFELPLAPEGTTFRKQVWHILNEIPYGETVTYGEIADKIASMRRKKSMSAQAVGGAVGHNPISIIVPCHRVIGSDGSLTGYAGGLDKKELLLAHERKHKHGKRQVI